MSFGSPSKKTESRFFRIPGELDLIRYLDTGTATPPFDTIRKFDVDGKTYEIADLRALEEQGLLTSTRSWRVFEILLESVVRNADGERITASDVRNAAGWKLDVPPEEDRGLLGSVTDRVLPLTTRSATIVKTEVSE